MKRCLKCGLALAFKKLPSGKWCPTNPDGSDHWDLCRETKLAAMSSDERAWLDQRDAEQARPVTTGNIKFAYCGDVPPWDESLGPFRAFTDEEKLPGSHVARRVAKALKRAA